MNINLIEHIDGLRILYGGDFPKFNIFELVEFSVYPGADLHVQIKLETKELPLALPKKWKAQEVNSLLMVFDLGAAEFIDFGLNQKMPKLVEVQVEDFEKYKILSVQKEGEVVFAIKSNWIQLNSFSGYSSE